MAMRWSSGPLQPRRQSLAGAIRRAVAPKPATLPRTGRVAPRPGPVTPLPGVVPKRTLAAPTALQQRSTRGSPAMTAHEMACGYRKLDMPMAMHKKMA